jgi:hypothetical protein
LFELDDTRLILTPHTGTACLATRACVVWFSAAAGCPLRLSLLRLACSPSEHESYFFVLLRVVAASQCTHSLLLVDCGFPEYRCGRVNCVCNWCVCICVALRGRLRMRTQAHAHTGPREPGRWLARRATASSSQVTVLSHHSTVSSARSDQLACFWESEHEFLVLE